MIRLYKPTDKEQIIKIAYDIWNDEVNISKELKPLIYKFLIEYYLYQNDLTFVDSTNDKINGFALAFSKKKETNAIKNLKESIKNLSIKDQKDAIEYIEYIDTNSKKVHELMNDKTDVYFGLLASIKHGVGKELINNLKNKSKELGKNRIFFWTDETCNYKYYEQEEFKRIDQYQIEFYGKPIKTFIYVIEL